MEHRLDGGKAPDPEVPERAARRRFTTAYKLRILREADRCREPGAIGALLRGEGLYSSHLTAWRKQRDAGALEALSARKRGAKPKRTREEHERERLERENTRLRHKLVQAEEIIAVQKKLSEVLGRSLEPSNGENG